MHLRIKTLTRLLAAAFLSIFLTSTAWATDNAARPSNSELVRQSFVNWQQGKGTTFDLLAPDAVWTVVGSSPVSGVYKSRQGQLSITAT